MCKRIKFYLILVIIGMISLYNIYSLPASETLLFALIFTAFPLLVCYAFTSCKSRRIGELAMQKDWLTEEEVINILLYQRKYTHKFGEIAIREKYLSPVKVEKLLIEQSALFA